MQMIPDEMIHIDPWSNPQNKHLYAQANVNQTKQENKTLAP